MTDEKIIGDDGTLFDSVEAYWLHDAHYKLSCQIEYLERVTPVPVARYERLCRANELLEQAIQILCEDDL